jgi:PAS domain-containing protein
MDDSSMLAGLDARTVMDTVQSALFVMDSEARILALNRSAAKLVPPNEDAILHQLCGAVLRCIHEENAPNGCGSTDHCRDCLIRRTVAEVCSGRAVTNRRADVQLRSSDGSYRAVFLISAAPFRSQDQPLALLSMQDITDIVVLRDVILPMCSRCRKIHLQGKDEEDPASWVSLEAYIRNASNTEFTHGMCPTCVREFYGDDLAR